MPVLVYELAIDNCTPAFGQISDCELIALFEAGIEEHGDGGVQR